MKYIDADALSESVNALLCRADANEKAACLFTMSMLANEPAADVVPVVHAKWVRKYNVFRSEYDGSIIEGYDPACSACDSWSPGLGKYKFCPYCGAKMDA